MPATSIIGIGSHHGADQLGWLACEQLKKLNWPETIDIQLCRTPAQLPELLSNCQNAILIDTLQSKTDCGEILSLRIEDLADNILASQSTHGFGVTEALELSDALGQLPTSTIILGIAIDDKMHKTNDISQSLLLKLQKIIYESLIS